MHHHELLPPDAADTIPELLVRHPSVRAARLAGSRRKGTATALSDVDIEVEVGDFSKFERDLPELVKSLEPLGQMWDRLGDRRTYMLMLDGPLKVDIITDEGQHDCPPWKVSAQTLPRIEHHFWDWILWLGSKHLHAQDDLVRRELDKMHVHLLQPLGVERPPRDLAAAVGDYVQARNQAERALGVEIDRRMGKQVRGALRRAGILQAD
jgi:predicted nucleotidyltransferase